MKVLKLILLNIIIVCSLFLLSELYIRIAFPGIKISGTAKELLKDSVYYNSPGLVPNSEGLSNGTIKSVNALGFWKYTGSAGKNRKILYLGDSVTMGIGIKNDSTFAGRINNTIDSISIYNPSLIGYSSEDYKNIIQYIFIKENNNLDIDEVVLVPQ